MKSAFSFMDHTIKSPYTNVQRANKAMRSSVGACSHLLIHFLGHSPLCCINLPSSSHRLPSQADSHSPVCLLILTLMCSNSPSLHCPTHLHAHKSFCLLCKEDFTWNVSSKEIIPYPGGLVCCPMKTLALRCSSYQEFPSDLNFLPLICPSLSIDFMTDLSVFVFTLRLQISQHGPGGKVLHLSPQNIWSQVSCLVFFFLFCCTTWQVGS